MYKNIVVVGNSFSLLLFCSIMFFPEKALEIRNWSPF